MPPLVVAEAFGTLAELYPGRIDLGLGRAPGTDPTTACAAPQPWRPKKRLPRDVAELQRLLAPAEPGQRLIAMPGAGTNVPGSGCWAPACFAPAGGRAGLPYAFASHFAPRRTGDDLCIHRPSAVAQAPVPLACRLIPAPDGTKRPTTWPSSTYQRVLGILATVYARCRPSGATLRPATAGAGCNWRPIGGPDLRAGAPAPTGADELMLVSA